MYIQYTNPAGYPPLEHSSRILAESGWKVLFLGTRAFGADSLEMPSHRSICVRQLGSQPVGWRLRLHYLRYCAWVFVWALLWRPDWVYASDPLSCPIALVLSLMPRFGIIYHEHDAPLEGGSAFLRMCLKARRWLARRAAICIVPDPHRAALFAKEHRLADSDRVLCVWNCPLPEEIAAASKPPLEEALLLYYHGSIGPTRLQLAVLEALAMLPDRVRLLAVGYETIGHVGYIDHLKEEAARLGVADRVEFAGPLNRDALLTQCRRADVGLALVPPQSDDLNTRYLVGASNKAFEYLACGLAILVSDLADWECTYVKQGYGIMCDPTSPRSIADAVRWFLEHPLELRQMGEQGRQRVATAWNYEAQFAPVVQRMLARYKEGEPKWDRALI